MVPASPAAPSPDRAIPAATGWPALTAELDAWRAAGMQARLWWRDDDATAPSPALDRLLDLAERFGVPLALAVIPAHATAALARRLQRAGRVTVLQHGWRHADHADPGAKKIEIRDGIADGTARLDADLSAGAARLSDLFGTRALKVLVPPWNRIGDGVTGRLPALGLAGISLFGGAGGAGPPRRVDTHIDIVDWHRGRGFVGDDRALAACVSALADRRRGLVDPASPVGLLTHHRDHDAGCWRFIETFLSATTGHPAVAWQAADTLFGDNP